MTITNHSSRRSIDIAVCFAGIGFFAAVYPVKMFGYKRCCFIGWQTGGRAFHLVKLGA